MTAYTMTALIDGTSEQADAVRRTILPALHGATWDTAPMPWVLGRKMLTVQFTAPDDNTAVVRVRDAVAAAPGFKSPLRVRVLRDAAVVGMVAA